MFRSMQMVMVAGLVAALASLVPGEAFARRAVVVAPAPVVVAPVVAPVPPGVVRRAARVQRRWGYPVAVGVVPAVVVAPPMMQVTTWQSPTGYLYRPEYRSDVMPQWPGVMPSQPAYPQAPEAQPTLAPQAAPAPQPAPQSAPMPDWPELEPPAPGAELIPAPQPAGR